MATLLGEDNIQVCLEALVVVSVEWFMDLLHVLLCDTDRKLAEEP